MIGLGVALLVVVLLAVGLGVAFGREDHGAARSGTAGPSATDPGPAQEMIGDGDPSYFGAVMPSGDEVRSAMGGAEHLALAREEVQGASAMEIGCTDIDINALAYHQQYWVDDDPGGGWELQIAAYDYGTAAEAHRAIAVRWDESYAECVEASGINTVRYGDGATGYLLESRADRSDPPYATVLMGDDGILGCPTDEGRFALMWRQVDRYLVSAKALGCEGIDLDTVGPILDGLEDRLR